MKAITFVGNFFFFQFFLKATQLEQMKNEYDEANASRDKTELSIQHAEKVIHIYLENYNLSVKLFVSFVFENIFSDLPSMLLNTKM
jgi:hypothetical protein